MTGICGWAGPDGGGEDPRAVLERMTREAGPDGVACAVVGERGVVAAAGKRAWLDEGEELVVAISGHPRFRDKSGEDGLAQALAETYLERGELVLTELRGPFGLAVLDLREGSALVAVDRLGIESMYYSVSGESLVFGSRAGAVALHFPARRALDSQSVFDYLYFHCIPSPRSVYRGQQKLLPGQLVRFRRGRLEKDFYWTLDYSDEPAPFAPLKEEFRFRLEQAVRHAAEGSRLGAFLSGGTDSSTVAGLLTKIQSHPADTYSIGFAAEGYDEMGYARVAARHFGTRAHEYYVTAEDVVNAIPLVARSYDEPFGNASAVPAYYCARLAAADGVSALLAGDGGDELFAGNARYARQLMLESYKRIPGWLRHELVEPLLLRAPGIRHLAPLRKLRSYVDQARLPLPDRLEAYNLLHRTALNEIFEHDFLESVDPDEPLANLREAYERTRSRSALNRMLHLDLKITLADNDLRKVSRMCEAAGVEARFPMLDEDLVELSGRVPPDLKLRHFELRYFFKQALKDFLPQAVLAKPKHGFGLPFGLWLGQHKPLQALVHENLASLQRRGYLKRAYVDDLLRRHREEHAAYYGVMIWVLMMLEQWLQAHTE